MVEKGLHGRNVAPAIKRVDRGQSPILLPRGDDLPVAGAIAEDRARQFRVAGEERQIFEAEARARHQASRTSPNGATAQAASPAAR